MRRLPPEVLSRAPRLFWDVDIATLDPEAHEDFILGHVLVEGDWSCVRALRSEVGDEKLKDFVRRSGRRRLDIRTRRFFEAIFDLPQEPCETTSSNRRSAPLFVP